MNILRYILFPIVPIYYFVTWLRNLLYDAGVFSSKTYDFPVICVGNLSVGGTGKSPMIEYLIRLLKDNKRLATLSRGYKRSTEGFCVADEIATAKTIGDEPFQFYRKYANDITVAVDANRQNGIANLMDLKNAPEVILLDDAYQHRKVQAGFNILLSTYSDLYVNDWVLPTGNLREPRVGAKRANVIVITKCPTDISTSEKSKILKKISPKKGQRVFFSSIQYADDVFSEEREIPLSSLKDFTLVTGIANATPLVNHLQNQGLQFDHLHYKDHYHFTNEDIDLFEKKSLILTTEKDYVRLLQHTSLKDKVFYLPIEVSIDKTESFNMLIENFVTA